MIDFDTWCVIAESEVGDHHLHLLTVEPGNVETAATCIANVIPEHYTSQENLARIFERHGKPGVANRIRAMLPEADRIKSMSGDLGEIIATEYIDEKLSFDTPIKRFRWKDHRNQAMRGDDVIGIRLTEGDEQIEFLKVEAKSRAALNTRAVADARSALNGENGLPTVHALTFMADRLLEIGNVDLSDAINDVLLGPGIRSTQVENMVFTFSGNAPDNFLRADLNGYDGAIDQSSVGLRIVGHQDFIRQVFELARNNEE